MTECGKGGKERESAITPIPHFRFSPLFPFPLSVPSPYLSPYLTTHPFITPSPPYLFPCILLLPTSPPPLVILFLLLPYLPICHLFPSERYTSLSLRVHKSSSHTSKTEQSPTPRRPKNKAKQHPKPWGFIFTLFHRFQTLRGVSSDRKTWREG